MRDRSILSSRDGDVIVSKRVTYRSKRAINPDTASLIERGQCQALFYLAEERGMVIHNRCFLHGGTSIFRAGIP